MLLLHDCSLKFYFMFKFFAFCFLFPPPLDIGLFTKDLPLPIQSRRFRCHSRHLGALGQSE